MTISEEQINKRISKQEKFSIGYEELREPRKKTTVRRGPIKKTDLNSSERKTKEKIYTESSNNFEENREFNQSNTENNELDNNKNFESTENKNEYSRHLGYHKNKYRREIIQRNQQSKQLKPKYQHQIRQNHKKTQQKSTYRNQGKRNVFLLDNAIDLGQLPESDFWKDPEALHVLLKPVNNYQIHITLNEIYNFSIKSLVEFAKNLNIEVKGVLNRQNLIQEIIQKSYKKGIPTFVEGVLDILSTGHGILVYENDNYFPKPLSAFIHLRMIQKFALDRGHSIKALIHPAIPGESNPFVLKIFTVSGLSPDLITSLVTFNELTPCYPTERLLLESSVKSHSITNNLSMRVIDLLTPLGLGQRGLIVAPPRTGKTMLLQSVANAIAQNRPDVHLIVLLIDERPEEVTDFRRQVKGDVISSTFDQPAVNHVHVAEMVINKARRMVEAGLNVVILLDAITRLARAYNTMMPSSGKVLSGGVEANALQRPKRFFGSARNIENGGSLTILASALIETGSRMDEVIFEEFKGTGNMEVHLDRGLSDKRIYPAINLEKSGTRKEELLYHPDEMNKVFSLRRAMKGAPVLESMEMLIQRIQKTKSNAEFLMSLHR